jgi:RNA ligase (TIGR02306 family)
MRKLASIKQIAEVRSIPDADKICAYRVDGWWVVDAVGKYQVGDLVVYCEVDSWIPNTIAPFLSKGQEPREFEGVKGERLRTIRLRGQLSQGLLLSLGHCAEAVCNSNSVLEMDVVELQKTYSSLSEGTDLTDALHILKYEAPIPAQLAGEVRGMFPGVIPKTDQERIQNLVSELETWTNSNLSWEVTEKLDGSSMTVYVHDEDEGVCSRNLNLKESDTNSLWKLARKYDMITKIRATGRNLALQGEIIGEGIQGNPYKLKGQDFYLFDIYDIDQGKYLTPTERVKLVETMGIKHVPIEPGDWHFFDETVEYLLECAEGKSQLCATTEQEGLVFKCHNADHSFKAISNKFLLKSGG